MGVRLRLQGTGSDRGMDGKTGYFIHTKTASFLIVVTAYTYTRMYIRIQNKMHCID